MHCVVFCKSKLIPIEKPFSPTFSLNVFVNILLILTSTIIQYLLKSRSKNKRVIHIPHTSGRKTSGQYHRNKKQAITTTCWKWVCEIVPLRPWHGSPGSLTRKWAFLMQHDYLQSNESAWSELVRVGEQFVGTRSMRSYWCRIEVKNTMLNEQTSGTDEFWKLWNGKH